MDRSDEQMLGWLLRHPLQRDTDLALALGIHPTTVYRHLVRLEQAGVVEHVTPSGKTHRQRWYYLTNAGVQDVAAKQGASPVALARTFGADESGLLRLLARMPVVELLQQVITGLVAHAPSILAYPNGERPQLTWHWQRDWRHSFASKGRTLHCRADAVLVVQRALQRGDGPGDYYALLLLADSGLTGQNDHQIMQQRLERLLRYRESAERTTHFQAMPTIAVLVPHLHQQERWRHAGQEVCTTLRLDPLRGAVVALSPSQRLDSAWVLPWKGLESDAPCRLQDLLLPTALEALPPDFFPTMADSAIPGERTRLVIKGGYARRPKQVGAKGKQSAPHLLSLHLSERQQALLHLVYAAPLLSTVEIAALCALAPATATRQLYDLHRDGYLERQQTKRGCCWRLSCLGLRWMAALLDVSIQHLTQGTKDALIQRGVPLLERTIQHTAGIYGFLAHLHCDARAQGHQVAWWETGSWGERRYHEHGAWHSLRPDAAFAYRTGSAQILAWLEWDEGTMTGGALAAKFRAYAQYLHSREWAKEMRPLPLLLIVTPEPGQERRLQGLSGPLVAAGLRAFLTTATRLADQGPIAPIWLPPSATPSEAAASRQSWIE